MKLHPFSNGKCNALQQRETANVKLCNNMKWQMQRVATT